METSSRILANLLTQKVLFFSIVISVLTGCKETPDVTTDIVTNPGTDSARGGGKVLDDGNADITSRGVCWSTTQSPSIADAKTEDGTGIGSFTSEITQLTPNTKYYVKAYATNSKGTGYGAMESFTTLSVLKATVATSEVTSITTISAVCGGNVTDDGRAFVTNRGVCWNTSVRPTTSNFKTVDGSGTGNFISIISNLQRYTTYYVRAYAENSQGIAYDENEITFRTRAEAPILTTDQVSSITKTEAVCGGNITNDGGAPIISRGVCWSMQENPDLGDFHTSDGNGSGHFASYLSSLKPGTIYYVRAYAINVDDTAYGYQRNFPTSPGILDVDNNAYNIVTIGTQTWMAENLRTKRLNDRTVIANVTDNTAWAGTANPAYCWYNNDGKDLAQIEALGALYNWYTINTNKLCPPGWHVPTGSDLAALYTHLGGIENFGRLKEEGLEWWNSPNTGASNKTGFSARGGGRRLATGAFAGIKYYGFWWTAQQLSATDAYFISLSYNSGSGNYNSISKNAGNSVRCIKN